MLTSFISGSWGWVSAIAALASDVNTDADGNVYVAGGLSGSNYNGYLDFDPGPDEYSIRPQNGTDPAYGDAFIAKYDTSGAFQWVRTLSVPWGDAGLNHVETATDGSLRLIGIASNKHTWQSADLYVSSPNSGSQSLVTIGPNRTESFACSITTAGVFQWLTVLPTGAKSVVSGTNIDPTTQDFVVGADGQALYRVSQDGQLLSSPSPFTQLSNLGGTSGSISIAQSAVDSQGSLLVAGSFSGGVDFDPSPNTQTRYSTFQWDWDTYHNNLIRHWSADVFLARYDATGNLLWVATQGDAASRERIGGLTLSPDGAFTIGGYREASDTGFISSYSSSGTLIWSRDTPVYTTNEIGTVTDALYLPSGAIALLTTNGLLSTDAATGTASEWISHITEGNISGGLIDPLGRFVAWSTGPRGYGRSWPNTAMDISGPFPLVRATYNNGAGSTYPGTYVAGINLGNRTPIDISIDTPSIPENQPASTKVGTLSANDQDAGDSITYTLVSGSGSSDNSSFTIIGDTLRAAAPLNYEARSQYSIRVRATDNGRLFSEQQLTIRINDVNEAPTAITLSGMSIDELQPAGTTVGDFSSSDPDAGDSLTYTLVTGAGDADNTTFAVAGTSLKTSRVFNYEERTSYSIRARATDANGLLIERTFTITVRDVNEAPLGITLSSSAVEELRDAGTTVGTFSATDPDTGSVFTYALTEGLGSAGNAYFAIEGNTLKSADIFDYSLKNRYSIRVRSTDQGGLSISSIFTIQVTGHNSPPTGITLSGTAVAENSTPGTFVGAITTSDPDRSNTFSYSFASGGEPNDNSFFAVDGDTLRTDATFNYEAKLSYAVRIRSTDQGGLSVERGFEIRVSDVDEAPLGMTLSSSAVEELRDAGTTVGTFSTTDPDTGSVFTYALTDGLGSADNAFFAIEGNTLKTADIFNYGSKNRYSIRVRSTDQGGLSISSIFTIQVTGNNRSPTSISLSGAAVPENSNPGTFVGAITTSDPDRNSTFSYSFASGGEPNDNSFFAVDGDTLRTDATFNYEAKLSYAVRIRSTDQGGLSVERGFEIRVSDVLEDLAVDRIEVPLDRTYKSGEALFFTLVLTRPVAVTGKPDIDLLVGNTKRSAVYQSGSGSNRLVLSYTVKAGDNSPAGVVLGRALRLPIGSTIRSGTTNLPLALPPTATPGVRIDTALPRVTSIVGPSPGVYKAGDRLSFSATTSEPVSVSGVPYIPVTVGKVVRSATFVAAKSSPRALVFEYRVQAGDNDADGISVKNAISLPPVSSAVDSAGNAMVLAFAPPVTKRVLIDTLSPAVTSIKPPTAKIYRGGDAIELTVTFSEPVQVTGTPVILLTIGDRSRIASFAGYAPGSANRSLRFRAVASPGDLDTDGVSYGNSITTSSATISDGVGNAASVVLPSVSFAKVLVDAVPPTVLAVTQPVFDAKGSTLTVRVTFSERVVVTGRPTVPFTLGFANRSLTYVSGTGNSVLVFHYSIIKKTDDASLPVTIGSAVGLVSAAIRDVAGNGLASASLPRAS